jgi:hypothetical protein
VKDERTSSEHIFPEIFSELNTLAARLLEGVGLTYEHVYEAIRQMRG